MSMTALLNNVSLVTTPLSLVAFITAAIVISHAKAIGRAERLIRTAPEGDRKTLVAGALQILNLDEKKLTREQRFELALQHLHQRRLRSWMAFSISLILAGLFASVAIYSVVTFKEDPRKAITTWLAGPEQPTVLAELEARGIYDAEDGDIVDYLVRKTAIPSTQEKQASEADLIRLATERYDSVPSVKELRLRADARQEPFRPIGELMVVTVPGERDDEPRQFSANVPKNSKLKWKVIRVTNPLTNRYIRVLARPVMDDSPRGTDLHLNREQSIYLNGGAQIPNKTEMIVRETSEAILDSNCSIEGRSTNLVPVAKLLCGQGRSIEVASLVRITGG